jgi:hypothetical protein
MPQWLVVNPNTSETVTQALVHHLSVDTPRRRWGDGGVWCALYRR